MLDKNITYIIQETRALCSLQHKRNRKKRPNLSCNGYHIDFQHSLQSIPSSEFMWTRIIIDCNILHIYSTVQKSLAPYFYKYKFGL